MTRLVLTGAIALAFLHACAPPQPPGRDLWKGVSCTQKGTC